MELKPEVRGIRLEYKKVKRWERIGVRISADDKDLICYACLLRCEDISDFIRRAIKRELASLNLLDEQTKKVLGI